MFRKDRRSAQIHPFCKASNFILCVICLIFSTVQAQFTDTFPPGSPLHTDWNGDTAHFKVNAEGFLQLEAPAAGKSLLYRPFSISADSLVVHLFFRMDFAPSAENSLKIYLWTTSFDESKATGLYLTAGESGSHDAIHLWQMENGRHQRLGSGRLGAVANDPAQARIRLAFHGKQLCSLMTDYSGGHWLEEDLVCATNLSMPGEKLYFGIRCTYTTSRKSLFFLDDISVSRDSADTTPLVIQKVVPESSTCVRVYLSERPEATKVKQTSMYNVQPILGHPDSVIFPLQQPGQVLLCFHEALSSEYAYTLTVDSLPDESGNFIRQQTAFLFPATPGKGDLLLSEILFYPETGGADFVEVHNRSNKYLSLDYLLVSNDKIPQTIALSTQRILPPGAYLAVSKDTSWLKQQYSPPSSAAFMQWPLPQLPSDEGIVCLRVATREGYSTLDSFTYKQSMHSALLTNLQGVSLERVNFHLSAHEAAAWHSGITSTQYATPGYKNASIMASVGSEKPRGVVSVVPAVITPDGDGADDVASLSIVLDIPGYVASLAVYDVEGFPVAVLTNNQLLGEENLFYWDGQEAGGRRVQGGMYYIVCRGFHPSGHTFYDVSTVSVVTFK